MANMTKKKREYVTALLATPFARQIDLARMVGITPQAICKWNQDPEFKAYIDQKLKEKWEAATKDAMATLLEIMQNGKEDNRVKAATYVMNSAGYQAPTQVELQTNTIKVTIEDND